jgi:hypothetical protein
MPEETPRARLFGTWIGLALAAAVTIALTGAVDWLIMFGQSSTCNEAPDPDEVRAGRLALFVVFLVVAAPWAVGTAMSHRRFAIVVAGAVAVTPALVLFLNGLRTDAWVGGFCF